MNESLTQTLLYAAFAVAGWFLKQWLAPKTPTPAPLVPPAPAPASPTVIGAMVDEIEARRIEKHRQDAAARLADFVMTGPPPAK